MSDPRDSLPQKTLNGDFGPQSAQIGKKTSAGFWVRKTPRSGWGRAWGLSLRVSLEFILSAHDDLVNCGEDRPPSLSVRGFKLIGSHLALGAEKPDTPAKHE